MRGNQEVRQQKTQKSCPSHGAVQSEDFTGHTTVCVGPQSLSHVQLFATPWTAACQAPLSMRVSRQEYWSGLPTPNPQIEPVSLASPALAGGSFYHCTTREALHHNWGIHIVSGCLSAISLLLPQ